MTNINTTAEFVADLYSKACTEYDNTLARDRAQRAQEFKGDGSLQLDGRIWSDSNQQAVQREIGIARDRATAAIDRAVNECKRKLTDAPSTDEANYIVSIAQRDDMTETEITAALDRYRSHAAQHAIRAAAHRSGLRHLAGQTETEASLDALAKMREQVQHDFTVNAIGRSSAGFRRMTGNHYKALASGADGGSLQDQLAAMFS